MEEDNMMKHVTCVLVNEIPGANGGGEKDCEEG
jgi:hypothetical protein